MTRTALALAALASAAAPGLDPATVEGVLTQPGDLYEVAFITDSQDRRWVIKVPRTPAAGALLGDVTALTTLLGRRLDVAVPMARGQVLVADGPAVVYLRVPGRPLDFRGLPAGPGLAGEIGRVLGHIHNVEPAVYEEAGRPCYDAETHRQRLLTEVDRAAATGHVPTGLLGRWERALEDVSRWRFAATPIHGSFRGPNVLASFDDDSDASRGTVRGVLSWEEARIADPADDLAELAGRASPAAFDAVIEGYAQARVERPDPGLIERARLASEMALCRRLLTALSAGELELVERTAAALRRLDERTHAEDKRLAEQERGAREERARQRARQQAEARDRAAVEQQAIEVQGEATQPHATFLAAGLGHEDDARPATVDHGPDTETKETTLRDTTLRDTAVPLSAQPRGDDADGSGSNSTDAKGRNDKSRDDNNRDEEAAGALLDVHEGASDFVHVERRNGQPRP